MKGLSIDFVWFQFAKLQNKCVKNVIMRVFYQKKCTMAMICTILGLKNEKNAAEIWSFGTNVLILHRFSAIGRLAQLV